MFNLASGLAGIHEHVCISWRSPRPLNEDSQLSYQFHENFLARYIADFTRRPKVERKLKVLIAGRQRPAGAFKPDGAEHGSTLPTPNTVKQNGQLQGLQCQMTRNI
jgi:hypothetical protein